MKKDLSEIKGTIGYDLKKHKDELNLIIDTNTLYTKCVEILAENTQKAKEKFLSDLRACRTISKAQSCIWNWILAGDGQRVI